MPSPKVPVSLAVFSAGSPGWPRLERLMLGVWLLLAVFPAASVAVAVNCLLVAEPIFVQSVEVSA